MTIALPPQSCNVYTPKSLALAIVQALGDVPDAQWLEPSHGRGSFLEALRDTDVESARVTAIDLDPVSCAADRLAKTHRGVDFLCWAKRTGHRFDRVVGNPPYVAINQLDHPLRETAASVTDLDQLPIGLGANTWYAFVLAALAILKRGGSLGFVLPSAAEYADYSAAIRSAVRNSFGQIDLYRCKQPLFDDVQEGTVVAIGRDYGAAGPCRFRRREFNGRDELVDALKASVAHRGRPCPERASTNSNAVRTFGDVADIKLGGVTGDAAYFLLNEERRVQLGLPEEACAPVVSRARQLQAPLINLRTWRRLKQRNERVWLFNPDADVLQAASVSRYLSAPPTAGGCQRDAYKVRSRDPWYRTPLPYRAHGFISGMSQHGPWICLNEMRGLNATNTLYVVTFRRGTTRDEHYSHALSLLTSQVQRQLRRCGRRYADGLVKYEPGSLMRLEIPAMRVHRECRAVYADAVRSLLAGNARVARQLADDFVLHASS